MYAAANAVGVLGIQGFLVRAEADIRQGLPCFDLVGLLGAAVREAKQRVRAAIANAGFPFPLQRITVNLAPADMHKDSPGFDLAIAVAILAAAGLIPGNRLDGVLFAGELSLEGKIRPVKGVLSMAVMARELGMKTLIVAAENLEEASLIEGPVCYGGNRLNEVADYLCGRGGLSVCRERSGSAGGDWAADDFSEVKGQQFVKRGLEIAVAGEHNVLMTGPPGAGKTMLAQRIPTILPPLRQEESLMIARIHSVAGLPVGDPATDMRRPFRRPHHSISVKGLIGGGSSRIRPGEMSLAHGGVLFLDELPEFRREAVEALRQPLEDAEVRLTRANQTIVFPARCLLVAAMNPCPCGFLGSDRECRCAETQIIRYRAKISGPILDRMDLHVDVPRATYEEITGSDGTYSSAAMKGRILAARERKEARESLWGIGHAGHDRRVLQDATEAARKLLKEAYQTLRLSARGFRKTLHLSRTVADLQDSAAIREEHVAEAVQYRSPDRRG